MSFRRSFSSSTNNEQIEEQSKNISNTIEAEVNRPLSLYDNLSALVASLKPPNLENNENSVNYTNFNNNKSFNSDLENNTNYNNGIKKSDVNFNQKQKNVNKSDDLLRNLKEEDFIFSDIKFNFPELKNSTHNPLLYHNDSDNQNNNIYYEIDDNQNNKIDRNFMNNNDLNENNEIMYHSPTSNLKNSSENLQSLSIKRPIISDAKSSFFGLLNDPNKTNENFLINDSQSEPLLESSTLNSMNTPVRVIPNTNFNAIEQHNRNSNENGECSKYLVDKTDIHFSENEDNFNNNNSTLKTVTYVTPEEYESKPSQAVYMSTTVPQNIKGSNIMGRHTPTRNSLRHSRMLVINKNFQGNYKSNPMDLQCPGLVKFILTIQIVIGILLSCIGLWILLWAPNTRTQDNPYWSGILLVVTATLGMILLEFKRSTRKKYRERFFQILKANSIVLFLFSGICAMAACVFATKHFQNLITAERDCMPAIVFTIASECVCIFGLNEDITDQKKIQNLERLEIPVGGYEFRYPDLSCSEVKEVWRYILLSSAIFNLIGVITVLVYFFLYCFKRNKRKYTVAL